MKICGVVLTVFLSLFIAGYASAHNQPVQSTDIPRSVEELERVGNVSDCIKCQFILDIASKELQNNATVAKIVAEIETKCDALPTKYQSICDDVAKALQKVLPEVGKFIYQAPYSPLALCGIIDQCSIGCCDTDLTPEQVHLSLTSNHTSMSAVWTTAVGQSSVIQYGTSPSALSSSSTGAIRTYTSGGWNGTIHTAVMTGLQQRTKYFYRVGDGVHWSQVFSFTTLGDFEHMPSLRAAVIGDMGLVNSNETFAYLEKLVISGSIDIILHVGDISYADGVSHRWDVFLRKFESVVANVPYMVIPGNHEIAYDFASYKTRFEMPGFSEDRLHFDGIGNMFYSFDAGPMHVLAYSTESVIDTAYVAPSGKKFIEQDLAAASANRSQHPFIVAMGHRPLYCSGHSFLQCEVFTAYLRYELEELFQKSHTDLVISGHIHNYERLYPTYMDKVQSTNYTDPKAPVYVVDGAAGNREGIQGFKSPAPSWSADRDSEYGYALMTVNATALDWTFVADSGHVVRDHFTITKS